MYGLDGKVYGQCSPFPGDDYFCGSPAGSREGVRMFRCLTTQWTAKQITDTFGNNRIRSVAREEAGNVTKAET
jgi:hypothetical protein